MQWEAKVNRSQEEFDNISKAIKKELDLFELQRVKDFKAAFIAYLESQLKSQDKVGLENVIDQLVDSQIELIHCSLFNQIIEHWETYMPEAKAIV